MAKAHVLKRKLKRHVREMHSIGKKYIAHTKIIADMPGNKARRMRIKKQLKILEKALKQLCKMERGE